MESGSPAAAPTKSVDAFDCAIRLAERKTARDWSNVQQRDRLHFRTGVRRIPDLVEMVYVALRGADMKRTMT